MYTAGQPRRDSNPQSSDPKSDALSIRPRGPLYTTMHSFFQKVSGMKSPPGLKTFELHNIAGQLSEEHKGSCCLTKEKFGKLRMHVGAFFTLAHTGIEPATLALLAPRSDQLS